MTDDDLIRKADEQREVFGVDRLRRYHAARGKTLTETLKEMQEQLLRERLEDGGDAA